MPKIFDDFDIEQFRKDSSLTTEQKIAYTVEEPDGTATVHLIDGTSHSFELVASDIHPEPLEAQRELVAAPGDVTENPQQHSIARRLGNVIYSAATHPVTLFVAPWAVSWMAAPYCAVAARAVFPAAYATAFGAVPAVYNPLRYLSYIPAREHAVAAAYNHGPTVIASASNAATLVIKTVPHAVTAIKSSVANTVTYLRGSQAAAAAPTPADNVSQSQKPLMIGWK